MANIKQQKKRILTDQKRKLRNQMFKSQLRTSLKKTEKAITENSKDVVKVVSSTISLLDKAKSKGVKKANFVNRHKSKIMQKLIKSSQKVKQDSE